MNQNDNLMVEKELRIHLEHTDELVKGGFVNWKVVVSNFFH